MRHPVDETRLTADLPNLDVEIVFREMPAERAEVVTISLKASPGFQAAAGLLAGPMLPLALMQAGASGAPFGPWGEMMRLAWQPWLEAASRVVAALEPPGKG